MVPTTHCGSQPRRNQNGFVFSDAHTHLRNRRTGFVLSNAQTRIAVDSLPPPNGFFLEFTEDRVFSVRQGDGLLGSRLPSRVRFAATPESRSPSTPMDPIGISTTRSCGSCEENTLWGIVATLLCPKPGLAWDVRIER